ncbi:MAG: uroporphyrinogen decarboxylase [Acidobacteriia bacterium]|nr:uroporphyrinogen decarboxylase [Terriglobia bacterium]
MKNDLFLRACRRSPVERVPVWLMRQAGRYMQAYRDVRRKVPFMDLVKNVELATEISLQPYRRFGMDAVILFSDILVPVEAMGIDVSIPEGGPRIGNPVRTPEDVRALRVPDPASETRFVLDILERVRRLVNDEVPVIGFAGAPYTLASYIVEGGSSRQYALIKSMLYGSPRVLHALLEKISDTIIRYLRAQVEAGAQALQLFDTWAGELSAAQYREFALPYVQRIFEETRKLGVPRILFVNGCAALFDDMLESGAEVLSVDWRVDLAEMRVRAGSRVALQGNVDPCVLLSTVGAVEKEAAEAIAKGGGLGHILNLGHGILPTTPEENVAAFVEAAKKVPLAAAEPKSS